MQNVLPITIIIAALVLSGTIFFVGNSINQNVSGLAAAVKGTAFAGTDLGTQTGNSGNPSPQPQAPSPTATVETKSLIKNAAQTLGSKDAKIVVVEFSDYQCPFCRSWFNSAKTQLDNDYIKNGKVLFVYKDFPLSFHPMAPVYAEAARCSGEQGKYWEMHDKIFAEQDKKGQGTVFDLTKDDVNNWAKQLGLKETEFNSCLDSGKFSQEIQANFDEGAQLGVSGTPSFFIGKIDGTAQKIVGAQPYSVFKQAIDSLS